MVLSRIIPINQVISNENEYRHEISDKRNKCRNRDFKANLLKIKCDTYNVLFSFSFVLYVVYVIHICLV